MTAFLLGLLIGAVIGMFFGGFLVIRTIYRDGYAIKNGRVVDGDDE